ncbi:hypothetical protein Ciccas_002212 [Cichlidogyrus casuarinus]|uniref:PID domain-containing protein n=1 Tax=Cichlidogyrus casuarinus TaxID=1844966 RepID=A0ABD2QHW6_9PLAT
MNGENCKSISELISTNSLSGLIKPDTIIRRAIYIQSIPVEETDLEFKTKVVDKFVTKPLEASIKGRPVLVCVSICGLRICSYDGSVIHMAHALRRISFATYDFNRRTFAFVAREPKSGAIIQYCHLFVVETADAAQELSLIVSRAFKLAYAKQMLIKSSLTKEEIEAGIARIPLLSDEFSICPLTERSAADLTPLLDFEIPPPPASEPPPPTDSTVSMEQNMGKQLRSISTPVAAEPPFQRRQQNNSSAGGRFLSQFRKSSSSSNANQSRSPSRSNSNNRVSKRNPKSALAAPNCVAQFDLIHYDSTLGSPVVYLKERIEAEAATRAALELSRQVSLLYY